MLHRANRSYIAQYSQNRVEFDEMQLAANLPQIQTIWWLFWLFLEHDPVGVVLE